MKKSDLHSAVSSEALLGKSKAYIHRALHCKNDGDLDQYQLWASLAIELLGKAALSAIHPSLVVDPTHYQSLFAASGINISADVKTISARTLFERLGHLSPAFDENVKKFCDAISQRRNAELHSGEVPFRAMKLEAWERHYWHASQSILEISNSSLEEWLGASQAKAPKEIVRQAEEAAIGAALIRVEQHRERFGKLKKKEREEALAAAQAKSAYHYRGLFRLLADAEWDTTCPACGGKAFLGGMQYGEEIIDTLYEESGMWEIVEKHLVPEEFRCPVCGLHLDSHGEIEAVGLDAEHTEIEDREREYEPEYGNE